MEIFKKIAFVVLIVCMVITLFTVIHSNASTITVYYQNDNAWRYHPYGYQDANGNIPGNIGTSGCGLLAYTNAIYYLNGCFIQPQTLADYSVANGHRVNGQGTAFKLYASFADSYGSAYGFKYVGETSSYSTLANYLLQGNVAICSIPGHIMACVDYDSSTGKYLILDSAPSSKRGTTSGYAWKTQAQMESLEFRNTFYILGSTGIAPQPTTCDCSESYAGQYICSTSETALNIRSGHGSNYSKVGSIPKGATVTVTKANGTWAHVTYNGVSGYVSMQYLTPTKWWSVYSPVDLGTDFTALILNTNAWKPIENCYWNGFKPQVKLGDENGLAEEVWYFQRQSDGSYLIASCYDGQYLDVRDASHELCTPVQTCGFTGSDAQYWFIYQIGNGYVLRSKLNDYVIDLTNGVTAVGTGIQMYEFNQTAAQIWSIYKIDSLAPPTNVELTKNQQWYDIGDTITLNVFANAATSYWISITKDGNTVVNQAINGTLSISASELGYGDFHAWVTAVNFAGGTDSNHIDFSVVGIPGYSNIYTDKNFYLLDDTISITVDTIVAKGQVIGIDKVGYGRVITQDCGSTFTVNAKELGVGEYSVYFSVYNGSGTIDTRRVKFEIGTELIPEIKTGLIPEDGGYRFYKNGVAQYGWVDTDGDGERDSYFYTTSKLRCEEDRVLFDGVDARRFFKYNPENGHMEIVNGFYTNENGTQFFKNGIGQYGWITADGVSITDRPGITLSDVHYFAYGDGLNFYMVEDSVKTIGGVVREFDENHLVKSYTGWATNKTTGNANYYVEGVLQQGWCETPDGWVYLSRSENLANNITYGDVFYGWRKISGKVYYFRASTSTPQYTVISDPSRDLTYEGVRSTYYINQTIATGTGADYYITNPPAGF